MTPTPFGNCTVPPDYSPGWLPYFPNILSCLKPGLFSTLFLCAFYTLLFGVGLISNVLIIFVALSKHLMRRSVANLLVITMALSDLLIICVSLPINLVITLFKPWVLGTAACKLGVYLQCVPMFITGHSLFVLAVERGFSLGRQPLSRKETGIVLLIIVTFALILYTPWLFTLKVDRVPNHDHLPYCHEQWRKPNYGKFYFGMANVLTGYLMPNFLVAGVLLDSWQKVSRTSQFSNDPKRAWKEANVLVIGLWVVFLVAWLPFQCLTTWTHFVDGGGETRAMATAISHLLVCVRSCANPAIYCWLNKSFWTAAQAVIPTLWGQPEGGLVRFRSRVSVVAAPENQEWVSLREIESPAVAEIEEDLEIEWEVKEEMRGNNQKIVETTIF